MEVKNCFTEEITFQLALKDEQEVATKRMENRYRRLNKHVQKILCKENVVRVGREII